MILYLCQANKSARPSLLDQPAPACTRLSTNQNLPRPFPRPRLPYAIETHDRYDSLFYILYHCLGGNSTSINVEPLRPVASCRHACNSSGVLVFTPCMPKACASAT